MIPTAVLAGSFDRNDVGRVLNDADHRRVATLVPAVLTERLVGDVEADLAETHLLLDLADHLAETRRVGSRGLQEMECDALCALGTYPRQA